MGMGMGGNMGMPPPGAYDARFSPSHFEAGLHPPEASGSGQRQFSSPNGSAGQGPRSADPPHDEQPTRTGDAS